MRVPARPPRLSVAIASLVLSSSVFLATGPVLGASKGLGTERHRVIVVLRNASEARPFARAAGQRLGFRPSHVFNDALNGFAATITSSAVAALRGDPRVLFVAPERELRRAAVGQPPQIISNGVLRIDGLRSSSISGDGKGSVNVNVAVVDTGIDDHPDLNLVGGHGCVPEEPGFYGDELSGHGTMVAGFIGAIDNKIGRVGTAPGARLWAVKVIPSGAPGGREADLICGLDWIVSTRTDADPRNDIAVANISLLAERRDDEKCGLKNRDPIHLAICNLTDAGVSVVAAAGNEHEDIRSWVPAAYDEVLTVAAMSDKDGMPGGLGGHLNCLPSEIDDTQATFTNFAGLAEDRRHLVAAPGSCISSTFPGGLYGVSSGTSFSSPLVAGVVALCIDSGPCRGLSPAQVIDRVVADAGLHNLADRSYGYLGDPLYEPKNHQYTGYLISASRY
jgi:subtilisin family serine protease